MLLIIIEYVKDKSVSDGSSSISKYPVEVGAITLFAICEFESKTGVSD